MMMGSLNDHPCNPIDMVVVGTSQGGFDALKIILSPLPADFNVPVLVVRHQPPDADDYIIKALCRATQLKISYALDGLTPEPGQVYLAPPDHHLLVGTDKRIVISRGKPVRFSRPAIDPLFQTAAVACGSHLAAVVLTGANSDGADGVKDVKAKGGVVIVQDPNSAEARAMPEAAMASVAVDHIIWLHQIGPFLWSLVRDCATKE